MRTRYHAVVALLSSRISFAQKEWIFAAMKDEMARTISNLKIDTLRPPYYVAYSVVEHESYFIRASMGSLLSSSETPRSRSINVQMRVGSPSFDNTDFASFSSLGRSGVTYVSDDGSKGVSYEDDYTELRRNLWLASDAVYKRSLADLSKKQAAVQNKVRTDTTADFSPARLYTSVAPENTEKFDRALWAERTRRLSAVLKKFPMIQYSEVNTGFADDYIYFLNSKGAKNTHQRIRTWVEVKAKTQASDGMPLTNFIAFYGNSLKDVPSEEEMANQIEAIAKELVALRDAPILDSYSGPVWFDGQAAAELVAQGLGPNLCNIRDVTTDNPQLEQMLKNQLGESSFQNKIGARVLPDFFSVTDNPRQRKYKGIPLIASFDVDEEGVQPVEVNLIERGILKTLLTSQIPHKRIRESNGHARGFQPQAFFSNLFLSASKTEKDPEIKRQLISLVKERGLEFGIIVRKINNPYFKQQLREESDPYSFGPGAPRPFVLEPILIYRVFPDGREELVRGAEITGMTAQSFKEILTASENEYVYNHITSQRKSSLMGLYNPSQIRVCVVTPSLLFESVDLKRTSVPYQTPPVASHPVFGR